MKSENLVLIDANSLIHRGFHALPPLTSPSGEPIGAVYGFSSILLKVIETLKPEFMIVAWDSSELTFRHKEFKDYKAHRPETPEDLSSQFVNAKRFLETLNLPQFELAGFEADDLIGTSVELCKKNKPELQILIVTGDLDMLQLVDEKTNVVTTKRGFSDTVEYDVDAVVSRYQGLRPEQLVDYKALVGDRSDNIPGVKGVGDKYAKQLLNKYHSLDGVYAHLDDIESRVSRLLRFGRESAYKSRILARIETNAPIEINWTLAEANQFDWVGVRSLFEEFGFKSLLDRLPRNITQTGEKKSDLLSELKKLGEARKYDEETFDIKIAAHLLSGLVGKELELDKLALKYFGEGLNIEHLSLEERNFVKLKLKERLESELQKEQNRKIIKLFQEVEMPLKPLLERMHDYGVKVDVDRLEYLTKIFDRRIESLTKEAYELLGREINLNSPKQLEEVLFDHLKLPVVRKTKTQRSTDESVLNQLKGLHPLVEKILQYRENFKIKSTYLDPLPKLLDKDNRVHTTFNQTKTASGRLSSENPNLQNIPVDPIWGLRKLFIPSDKKKLLVVDYSQIELRIMAHLTQDKHLLEAFEQGQDIHAATAARIFDKFIQDVDPLERKVGKTVNFALMYGMGSHGLSQQLGIDRAKAKRYIDSFFKNFPAVKEWQAKLLDQVRRQGFVETMFGRRRYLQTVSSSNFRQRAAAERVAINHPFQGTQADIIKMAMVEIDRKIQREDLKVDMLLQVHDELVFDVSEKKIDPVAEMIKDMMENVVKLSIPIKASVKVGENWQELKTILDR